MKCSREFVVADSEMVSPSLQTTRGPQVKLVLCEKGWSLAQCGSVVLSWLNVRSSPGRLLDSRWGSRKHRNSRKHWRKHSGEACDACRAAAESTVWHEKTDFCRFLKRLRSFRHTSSRWISTMWPCTRGRVLQLDWQVLGPIRESPAGKEFCGWFLVRERCVGRSSFSKAITDKIFSIYIMFSIQHHIHFLLYTVHCNHLHLDSKISFGNAKQKNMTFLRMYFFYCAWMDGGFMALWR